METENYRGFTIKIAQDECGLNPRTEWDNLGTMVCFHNRYTLGDQEHGFGSPGQLQKYVDSDEVLVALPLYLYDHSGITMNTSGFSSRWDSGQVGIIFITKEKVREEFGAKRVSKKLKKKITLYLQDEVKTYDKSISEGAFYYIIEETGDSCGGFLGCDNKESGLLECAQNSIDCEISHRIEERIKKVKEYIKNKVPMIYRILP